MRVHMKLMTDEKTVVVNISDTDAVSKIADLDPDAAELMAELHAFFDDVSQSNPDAGVVEITPENAVDVLGRAEKKKKAKKAS
jgi:hypothetical protein